MKKYFYTLEEVANFIGLTKQTLCNWIGCNKGYKTRSKRDKVNAVAGAFIVYHLFKKKRIDIIKRCISSLKQKCKEEGKVPNEIFLLKREINDIERIFYLFDKRKKERR